MCYSVKETAIDILIYIVTEKLLIKYVSFECDCTLLLTVSGYFICMQTLTDSQKPHDILESTTNTDGWTLELERVLPQLKVTIKTGMKLFPIQSCACILGIVTLFTHTTCLFFFELLFKKQCNLCHAREFTFLNRKPDILILIMG
jgi:hypothetical protein